MYLLFLFSATIMVKKDVYIIAGCLIYCSDDITRGNHYKLYKRSCTVDPPLLSLWPHLFRDAGHEKSRDSS